jgi:hypothetical protein|tara:strand:- start:2372 stop:2554 length:183 start_codon:yes stop_codon:yes gene_type:complete
MLSFSSVSAEYVLIIKEYIQDILGYSVEYRASTPSQGNPALRRADEKELQHDNKSDAVRA